jgi:hypothetical protein
MQPVSDSVDSAVEPLDILSGSTTDPLSGWADSVLGPVTDDAAPLLDPVTDTTPSTVEPVTDTATSTVEAVTDPTTSVLEPLLDTATSAAEPAMETATSAVGSVTETASSAVAPVADPALPTVGRTVEGATSAAPVAAPSVNEPIESAVGAVVEPIGDPTAPVVDAVPPIAEVTVPGSDVLHPAIEIEPFVPEATLSYLPEALLPVMGDPTAESTPVGLDAASPLFPETVGETSWSEILTDVVMGLGLTDLQIALGTTGLVAAGALAVARGADSPATTMVFSNVRLIPWYAHATIQRSGAVAIATSAPRVGAGAVTDVIHSRPIARGTGLVVDPVRDGFERVVRGALAAPDDGDRQLLERIGIVLGTIYLGFLTLWFWATRLRWNGGWRERV